MQAQYNYKGPYNREAGRVGEGDVMTEAEVGMWGHSSRSAGSFKKLGKAR